MEKLKGNLQFVQFREKDIETLRVIHCLKKSGLEIKEIKYFMDLCKKGKDTYAKTKKRNL